MSTNSQFSDAYAHIGQLFMPRLDIDAYTKEDTYRNEVEAWVREGLVIGFCVFGGTAELAIPAIIQLQAVAQSAGRDALLFSADFEFGFAMRFREGGTEFPDAMAMAKTGEAALAYAAGNAIGKEMRAIGIHWNFAPVCDVNSNPKNPIINTRSFGEEPKTVIEFSTQYMRGLQDAGIAATAKHFPGHGDTSRDSHHELPVIHGGLERFETTELPPFRALVQHGVDSVMLGHISTPELAAELGAPKNEQELPATLSRWITTGLLRERMGFTGVIVTDAMEMHAITQLVSDAEACLMAFHAGADVIVLPLNLRGSHARLREAYNTGEITPQRLNESIDRIDRLRKFTKSDSIGVAEASRNLEALEDVNGALSRTIGERSIQLVGSLDIPDGAQLLILADSRGRAFERAELFHRQTNSIFDVSVIVTPEHNLRIDEIDLTKPLVIATFHRARGYLNQGTPDLSVREMIERIAADLSKLSRRLEGLFLFGSPYLDSEFGAATPKFVLRTYSESASSVEAAVDLIMRSESRTVINTCE